ncbi:HD domain-containing protein [Thalassobaculum salexigens]|uniref:HD domain-containing protein n=1 Tax=Thalassobaculum salexigens TaxID=455360 RepID=UPI0009FE9E2A|nr:HD domain-containing protein [Thalassobaculum salexigens]
MNAEQGRFDPAQVLTLFMELNSLTKIRRAGWVLMGVSDAETISDHCYETALFAVVLSQFWEEPVDLRKVLIMALFHELGEVRLMDLPRRAGRYVKTAKKAAEHEIMMDVLDGLSPEIPLLLEEMEKKETPEARLCEAAEELQIIFKALVYAKENRGDCTEYREDVKNYNSLGIQPAHELAKLIGEKLEGYLGSKPYWPIGYTARKQS